MRILILFLVHIQSTEKNSKLKKKELNMNWNCVSLFYIFRIFNFSDRKFTLFKVSWHERASNNTLKLSHFSHTYSTHIRCVQNVSNKYYFFPSQTSRQKNEVWMMICRFFSFFLRINFFWVVFVDNRYEHLTFIIFIFSVSL